MTDSSLRQALAGLVAHWRWYADSVGGIATTPYHDGMRVCAKECAKELEAILAAHPAAPQGGVAGDGKDDYVAWLRFHRGAIQLCDSDTVGAFKVYRHPQPLQTSRESAGEREHVISLESATTIGVQIISEYQKLEQGGYTHWHKGNIGRMIQAGVDAATADSTPPSSAPSGLAQKGLRPLAELIIKADKETGSLHMTDHQTWGELMAEKLSLAQPLQQEGERK